MGRDSAASQSSARQLVTALCVTQAAHGAEAALSGLLPEAAWTRLHQLGGTDRPKTVQDRVNAGAVQSHASCRSLICCVALHKCRVGVALQQSPAAPQAHLCSSLLLHLLQRHCRLDSATASCSDCRVCRLTSQHPLVAPSAIAVQAWLCSSLLLHSLPSCACSPLQQPPAAPSAGCPQCGG